MIQISLADEISSWETYVKEGKTSDNEIVIRTFRIEHLDQASDKTTAMKNDYFGFWDAHQDMWFLFSKKDSGRLTTKFPLGFSGGNGTTLWESNGKTPLLIFHDTQSWAIPTAVTTKSPSLLQYLPLKKPEEREVENLGVIWYKKELLAIWGEHGVPVLLSRISHLGEVMQQKTRKVSELRNVKPSNACLEAITTIPETLYVERCKRAVQKLENEGLRASYQYFTTFYAVHYWTKEEGLQLFFSHNNKRFCVQPVAQQNHLFLNYFLQLKDKKFILFGSYNTGGAFPLGEVKERKAVILHSLKSLYSYSPPLTVQPEDTTLCVLGDHGSSYALSANKNGNPLGWEIIVNEEDIQEGQGINTPGKLRNYSTRSPITQIQELRSYCAQELEL